MKIQGLDGKMYSWIPSNNIVETEKRSGLHNKARQLLKEKYPNDRILEELVLPISGFVIYKLVPFARVSKSVEYKIDVKDE